MRAALTDPLAGWHFVGPLSVPGWANVLGDIATDVLLGLVGI